MADARGDLTIGQELRLSWKAMVAVVLGICAAGVPAYSLGTFIQPLTQEFGWSITEIAAWMMAWSAGCIVAAPVTGYMADRLGAKWVALIALVILSAVLVATGLWVDTLTEYYLSGFLIGVIVTGSSAITYGRIVSSLFSAGLGTALGIMSTGIGLSGIIGPRVLQGVIDAYGWRTGFYLQALFPLAIWPLLALWLREGRRDQMIANRAPKGEGYTLGVALRMPVFWVMSAGSLIYGVCVGGVTVNLMPFLGSEGLSRAAAASAVGLFGIATVSGRFFTGMIIDRFRLHAAIVMAVVLVTQALSFLLLAYGGTGVVMVVSLLVFGLTVGAEADCLALCAVRIFGRRYYGSIFGILGIVMLYIGTGAGPALFAIAQESAHSYQYSFLIWMACAMAAVPLFAWVSRVPFFVLAQQEKPA